MLEILILLAGLLVIAILQFWLIRQMALVQGRQQDEFAQRGEAAAQTHHLALLRDLREGLADQSARQGQMLNAVADSLRTTVSQELAMTRSDVQTLKLAQSEALAQTREQLASGLSGFAQAQQQALQTFRDATLMRLDEQGRGQQEMLQSALSHVAVQITATVGELAKTVDARLGEISGKVSERLDEGFKKTNETFASVMARLATIDEAQKKIDGLTSNVVTLQEILGDKRSRGAFGEVQLEALVRNILPPDSYVFQATLSNGSRVDCLLTLPEPTGRVAVDAKFPLENYHRMFSPELPEAERMQAMRGFRTDVKKHVDDISGKYLIAGETSEGAVMFVPAEAVFAEIHAHQPELVEYAMSRRVWLVSPTTLMAVLNTARAVIKDVETRRQVHIIKDELGKLSRDFARFDERMKKLASHIEQANRDVTDVRISSDKITRRFAQIESVDLDPLRPAVLPGDDDA